MNLLDESQLFVSRFDDHPLGLGIFTMTETLIADATVGTTFEIVEITTVTFVKHNEARNMHLTAFGRETWIQFLAFPLDYQTSNIFIVLFRSLVCCLCGITLEGMINLCWSRCGLFILSLCPKAWLFIN